MSSLGFTRFLYLSSDNSYQADPSDILRGEAVKVIGVTGYQESVRVEIVELPVTVL